MASLTCPKCKTLHQVSVGQHGYRAMPCKECGARIPLVALRQEEKRKPAVAKPVAVADPGPVPAPRPVAAPRSRHCPHCDEAIQFGAVKCRHCLQFIARGAGANIANDDDWLEAIASRFGLSPLIVVTAAGLAFTIAILAILLWLRSPQAVDDIGQAVVASRPGA